MSATTAVGDRSKRAETYWLVSAEGAHRGSRYPLDKASIVLGRSDDADIQLHATGVSRRHAKLSRSELGVLVVDLHSTNGTFINDVAVERGRAFPGDRLRLGPTACLCIEAGPMADASPLKHLSRRQFQVAKLVARGLTNAAIARELHISAHTVASHLDHIFGRLELHSRTALAAWVATREPGEE